MKKVYGWGLMILLVVIMLVVSTGCWSTAWNQNDANMVAQTLGAGAVTALNMKGDQLKPQEKTAAVAAITAFSALGSEDMSKGVPDQAAVNAMIAKVKGLDAAQIAAAQSMAASFMGIISPKITQAINSAGTTAGGQVFLAFCKGLASVPVNK